MGRKLDLSGLTDDETEHVLQVVQRDFNLRKKEEERLSEMKQKLDEEGSKCSILSKHQKFVEHCCMRCCSPFTFLVNTKRRCGDCKFNVCKSCCSYQKQEKIWICCVCQQTRLLRTQSLEWFYNNVKSRFKRFGSAKVLKNLYRKHRLESGACLDSLGGSFLDANLENEGSISGSDSTFYRHSEGHSMMDTLAVALRVAEEAIEEAISKAEACGDSLDKQNEASYLRDHKEELTEELATTILQKIIRKQKSKSEQLAGEEPEWSEAPSCSAQGAAEGSSTAVGGHHASTSLWVYQMQTRTRASADRPNALRASHTLLSSPWRKRLRLHTAEQSQPLFSFPGEEAQQAWSLEGACLPPREDRARGSWMSIDRLDDTGPSPLLQSPDGNWVALRNAPPASSRLLAKPKSAALQALEAASGTASAYDEMGSDSEEDFDWSEALSTLCPQPSGLRRSPRPQPSQIPGLDQGPPAASAVAAATASPGLCSNLEATCSDSETSSAGSSRDTGGRASLSWAPKKPPRSPAVQKMRLQAELDVNFNPQAASRETSDSSEPEEAPNAADRRARRWRRARGGSEELSKELSAPNAQDQELRSHQMPADLSETDISNATLHPCPDAPEAQGRNRLYELAMKMSEKETSSGEEQESEPKTESETQKESLSSEDNCQGVQEQLKKEKREALAVHLELQLLSTVLEQKYSAVSLCNISTEVLKVINATEELIAESAGPWECPAVPPEREKGTFPLGTDQVRLDKQLTSLEENVYLAAGTVYGLEGQLSELEAAARCIHSTTDETELAHLEDQVATAAAQVTMLSSRQHIRMLTSNLSIDLSPSSLPVKFSTRTATRKISDIESRISALTIAGLNIAPCGRLTRRRDQKQRNQVQTIDTSRQQRRKLPAPPVKAENSEASSLNIKTFNRNFILQGSSTNRTQERKTTSDLMDPSQESAVMY